MTDIDKPIAALMALGVATVVSKKLDTKEKDYKQFKFSPPSIKKLD
jgi:hypothetical protein